MSNLQRKSKDVSIIIPLYKGNKFCVRLLKMIEKNCLYKNLFYKCNVEVIFVNDYPVEHLEQLIFEKCNTIFDVKLIRHKKNMGIHASRVDGIKNANGEYVIMLDQDDLITENWLYSQWNKVVAQKADFCVCNGWGGRFRVLWEEKSFKNHLNDLNYYFKVGNVICSPGQVIMKKKRIPYQWILNIQRCNGTDDFLLWIMILKSGSVFLINSELLFYHTPERTFESIDMQGMIVSIKETTQILDNTGFIEESELGLLKNQIYIREYLNGNVSVKAQDSRINDISIVKEYFKFYNMFHIMLNWMKIRNKGLCVSDFLREKKYFTIAIYGMGYIGECLYDELFGGDIKVSYGIDRLAVDFKKELPIFKPGDNLAEVDAIVVTVSGGGQELIHSIEKHVFCPVITLNEIFISLDLIWERNILE